MPIFSSHRRLVYLLLASSMLLHACGDHNPSTKPGDHGSPPMLLSSPTELENYPFEDLACQTTEGADGVLQEAELTRWGPAGLERVKIEFPPLEIRQAPLRSRYVSGANYGGLFQRHCDSESARPPECLVEGGRASGWSIASSGIKINLCKATASPARLSAEHLAISAVATIESAGQKISKILGSEGALRPVEILIGPRFETQWSPWFEGQRPVRHESVLTDNMSYFAKSAKTPPYLALLPQRKKPNQNDHTKVNLWESPFIIVHEYGHHLEESLAPGRLSGRRSRLRMATSEAFSDLIAFSILGGSDSLAAIPCTGKDRAPDSLEFTTGIAKIFTTRIIQRTANFALTDATSPEFPNKDEAPCQGVTPHSPHGMGAIFAHWIAELSTYAPYDRGFQNDALMKFAVKWLKKVDAKIGSGIAIPDSTTGVADEGETKRELDVIVSALEACMIEEFDHSGKPMTPNIRGLLRQKMNFAFQALGARDWFPEQPPTTVHK